MADTIEQINTMANTRPKAARSTKLATTVIWGVSNSSLDGSAITKLIQNTIGIFHSTLVQIEQGNQVRIQITAEDQILETKGIMQTCVFNVLAALCQKLNIRILHVENQFLPEYA